MPPSLELSADSEVVLELPSLHPLLLRPLHLHDAPPSLRLRLHGMHLQPGTTWDGAFPWMQPGAYSLTCALLPDNAPQLLSLRIRVLVVFPSCTHNLSHNASACPVELHLVTCL